MLDLCVCVCVCVCVWFSLSSVFRSVCWRICRGFQFCFAGLLHTLILLHTSKKSHHIFTRGQITAISLSCLSFSRSSTHFGFLFWEEQRYPLFLGLRSTTELHIAHNSLPHTHTHTHTHTHLTETPAATGHSADLANQRGWVQDKLTGHKSNRADSHPTRSLST